MSTTRITISSTDGWVKVADAANDFLLENATNIPVFLAFSSTAPDPESTDYHTLRIREAITRLASGDVYVKIDYELADGVVIVSEG